MRMNFQTRSNINGRISIATAAHVASVGDVIKGTSSTIDKVTISQNWGSVDAAFLEITSTHNGNC